MFGSTTIMDKIELECINIKNKYISQVELKELVTKPTFKTTVQMVFSDFIAAYTEKGSTKYEDFQMTLFHSIRQYIYQEGEKQIIV